MEFFPRPGLVWLGGWVLLVAYLAVFGVTLWILPKSVVRKLYDRSGWTARQRAITRVGKLFALACTVLLALTPLKVGRGVFWLGVGVVALGLVGLVVALVNFTRMPPGEPATNGLYRLSRNPQWVALCLVYLGASVAVGSWLNVLLVVVLAVLFHARILAEEQSCIQLYGDGYRRYMKQVPRYLLFF